MDNNQINTVEVCLKSLLFVFNIVFWLIGLIFLGLGLWAELELYKYMELSPDFSGTGPYVIIGMAAFIVIISSVAFSCIIKGQPVLLFIYGGFLVCMFLVNCGIFASVVCFNQSFTKGLHDGLTQSVMYYDRNRTNIGFVQSTLHCCGVSNYTDWSRLSPHRVIPTSCCVEQSHCVTANYNDVYQVGCYEIISEYIEKNIMTVGKIAIAITLLPVIGAGLSCGLAGNLKCMNYDVFDDLVE
ncbi:tetraspanin-7-like [Leptidea sinapis]|uniref:Tetraspanin n=1 Tax=Leptidea sinapis TaxID=189913 RepID=A0A5E4Q1V3_9NEOP|nr:tetraspanin-7-like [Leptidea sinapis]VVC92202.1 unnamed protein product [Leptidea sinapis]